MDCVFLHRGVGCWQEGEGSRLRLFDGWVRELSTFFKEICVQHFVTFIKRRFEERTSRKANIPYFLYQGDKMDLPDFNPTDETRRRLLTPKPPVSIRHQRPTPCLSALLW